LGAADTYAGAANITENTKHLLYREKSLRLQAGFSLKDPAAEASFTTHKPQEMVDYFVTYFVPDESPTRDTH
jgi:hypothetical protein